MPSKFYGLAAVGKPIIVIADKNGEIPRLVQQHNCGMIIAPGDADALVDALRLLSNAPETISEMGRRARAMLDGHFTRQQALQRWSDCSVSSLNRRRQKAAETLKQVSGENFTGSFGRSSSATRSDLFR